MRPSWFVVYGAIACSCAVAPIALADAPLDLEWRAPPECPTRDWIIARIARYLERDPQRADSSELRVAVSVERAARGVLRATVALSSPEGERTRQLRDPECVIVADAVAFVVAHAIDPAVQANDAPMTPAELEGARAGAPGANGRTASGTRHDRDSQASPPEPARDDPRHAGGAAPPPAQAATRATTDDGDGDDDTEASNQRPSAPIEIGWSLGMEAALSWQPLPALAPGLGLRGAMRIADLVRVELGASYYAPQERALASDRSVVATFTRVSAALALCAVNSDESSEFGGCLELQAGVVRGDGAEFSQGNEAAVFHALLAPGPLFVWKPVAALGVRLQLAPTFYLWHPRFTVEAGDMLETVVHEGENIGIFAAIGLEARFD